jgi:hypothetical protein
MSNTSPRPNLAIDISAGSLDACCPPFIQFIRYHISAMRMIVPSTPPPPPARCWAASPAAAGATASGIPRHWPRARPSWRGRRYSSDVGVTNCRSGGPGGTLTAEQWLPQGISISRDGGAAWRGAGCGGCGAGARRGGGALWGAPAGSAAAPHVRLRLPEAQTLANSTDRPRAARALLPAWCFTPHRFKPWHRTARAGEP